MISLPMVISNTINTSNLPVSDGQQAGEDIRLPAGHGIDPHTAPPFLQLLGDRLVALIKNQSVQASTGHAHSEACPAVGTADNGISADLNQLLSQLDKPELLHTLLHASTSRQPVKNSEPTPQTATATLSSADMQTLQALLTMLPHNIVQAAGAPLTDSGDGNTTLITGEKRSGPPAPASLLTAAKHARNAISVSAKTAKISTATTATTVAPPHAHHPSPVATPEPVAPRPVEFTQSFLSARSSDKENSGSGPTTTPGVIVSTAGAAQTPSLTSQVSAPPGAHLSAQLGSQEWQHALGQHVIMFSRHGQHSAELHLHPEDLGSIQISLQLDNDQANLNMVSAHSQVRAALEAAIPHLRHALAASGINLGQSHVSSDAFAQGQSFAGQHEQSHHKNPAGHTFSLASGNESESDSVALAVPVSIQRLAADRGAVDIFA